MSTTHAGRLTRPSTALVIALAAGAALAIWMRPKKVGYEPLAPSPAHEPAQTAAAPALATATRAPEPPALAPSAIDGARTTGFERFERGEYAGALQLLAAVYRARPEDDAVALAVAEASLRTRDLRTAEVVIAALRQPDAPKALRVRALLFEHAGRLPEAVALYERAIAGLPEPQLAIEARAKVLSWLERFDAAAAGYESLIADERVSTEQKRRVRVRLAELTAWRKDLDGALAQLAAVLAEQPGRADALLLQGQILEWQGRYAEAKRSYSTLLAADASHAEARLRLDKLLWVR